jgi:hypothetical protein
MKIIRRLSLLLVINTILIFKVERIIFCPWVDRHLHRHEQTGEQCGWSTGFPTSLRLVHEKKSPPVDQLQFCPRQIFTHDSFTTRSNIYDLVVNMSWSRLCCMRFGQSKSRMPSCDSYAVRHHHVILQTKTFSWRRNKADYVGDVFFRWIIINVMSLPHDSFTTCSRQLSWTCREQVVNLSGTWWITRIRGMLPSECTFQYFKVTISLKERTWKFQVLSFNARGQKVKGQNRRNYFQSKLLLRCQYNQKSSNWLKLYSIKSLLCVIKISITFRKLWKWNEIYSLNWKSWDGIGCQRTAIELSARSDV